MCDPLSLKICFKDGRTESVVIRDGDDVGSKARKFVRSFVRNASETYEAALAKQIEASVETERRKRAAARGGDATQPASVPPDGEEAPAAKKPRLEPAPPPADAAMPPPAAAAPPAEEREPLPSGTVCVIRRSCCDGLTHAETRGNPTPEATAPPRAEGPLG